MPLRCLIILLGIACAAAAQPQGRRMTVRVAQARSAVRAPIAFRAVGAFGDAMQHRVRASADGVHWTDWLRSEPDSESSSLVWFETAQRFLQVENPSGDLTFLFIDPGATPPAETLTGPPFVTRAQWGCTLETCPAKDPPVYTTVTHLIVHHTDGANTAGDWAAVVRSIWVLHVQGNGWNDIGYNYLIAPNGVTYEGRAGGDGVLGAHFSSVNGGTMGVSLLGTYSTVPITQQARDTLRDMLAWQAAKWSIDPQAERLHTSSGLTLRTISGHRDANLASGATECPGNALYSILPALRVDLGQIVAGACPSTLSTENVCAPPEGGTIAVDVAAACPVTAAGPASWAQATVNGSKVSLNVAPNTGPRRSTQFAIAGRTLTIVQAAPGQWPAPCVAARGVVSTANDSGRPVVAGSLVSIYGANLATQTAVAGTIPLPSTLGDVRVTVDGRTAPLYFVSPGQINLQLPPQTNIGSARAIVTANGIAGAEVMFSVTEA
ncbi:MAG: type sorting protein, partial [Candidatus Solibacter sp.]|nr:type sorting protein [Candidatus Solibacter sp.]